MNPPCTLCVRSPFHKGDENYIQNGLYAMCGGENYYKAEEKSTKSGETGSLHVLEFYP